jgi:hypothetical protein
MEVSLNIALSSGVATSRRCRQNIQKLESFPSGTGTTATIGGFERLLRFSLLTVVDLAPLKRGQKIWVSPGQAMLRIFTLLLAPLQPTVTYLTHVKRCSLNQLDLPTSAMCLVYLSRIS